MTSERSFRITPNDDVTFYPRVFGRRGVVASHHYLSAGAGLDALKAGGNAVDAAVAATFVEGVLNPNMHTIGGECPILIAPADGSGIICINGNATAPAAATPEAFRALGHEAIPSEGVLAAGVPGAFGALIVAALRYGRLSFADLVRPALELARDGFPVHAGLLRQHKFGIVPNAERFLNHWPSTGDVYMPGGVPPAEGALLTNPALAGMFDHLAAVEAAAGGSREHGLQAVFDGFYRGDVAREIVAFSKEQGGLLERSDFDAFEIPLEQPVSIEFAGTRIYKCSAWNQGTALLQSLSILKARDVAAMGHNSADYVHTVTEAMKLAFADREQYYGDTRHVNIPVDELLDDAYGRLRAGLIDPAAANAELRPGDPTRPAALLDPAERFGGASWGAGTVHVDAADAAGNLCSFTPSGAWIKSSPVMPALGFPLGNRISNFHLGPAHHPNVVAPGKRPRTTISPTIVTRNDEPWIACGSMGGDQQDQWQLQFLLNRLLFDMPIQQAIEAPKFSSEHFPGFFAPHSFFTNRLRAEETLGAAVLEELARRGHEVSVGPAWSEGFMLATERHSAASGPAGTLEAGCDPRGAKSEVFPAAAVAW
ncbi:gamma-glutamyltransferase family protein (plasmid) [Skermanella mucosa]|uniref:gamma-glutamyltransferase family protein n=1 Tax=Skermanella mucosa TaxID=1789672 RepID=UPI00192A9FEC|nr:gamma-glutamyltransferase family protein [Skermanella mucosa]UEM24684.1 gamma-glutamyltransferase family protein [Skermanella mucosa]